MPKRHAILPAVYVTERASMTYRILDCTFRDGGYYTNWDFSEKLFQEYIHVLSSMDVECVELGYLSPDLPGYHGRFYYLPRHTLVQAKSGLRKDQKLAIMLNAKDCDPKTIGRVLKTGRDAVDVVRMAVAPSQIEQGLALARAVHAEGFEVAFNTMYLSKYIKDVSVLAPLAEAGDYLSTVSLVDSYGGCFPEDVGEAIAATKKLLPQQIGYHGHDNIMLAFACARAAIAAGCDVVDSTLLGMGRGAGNLRTELILSYKAAQEGKSVNFSELGHLVSQFETMQKRFGWGSNLPYIVSGMNDLPQKDVMDWLSKDRYSISSIVGALQNEGAGLLDTRDYTAVSKANAVHGSSTALIIGGGPSIAEHSDSIVDLASLLNCTVVHSSTKNVTSLSGLSAHALVCLPGHDVQRLEGAQNKTVGGFIVPAPPRFLGVVPEGVSSPVLQASPFLVKEDTKSLGPVSDVGPLALALGAARALGVSEVLLAGFDGYETAGLAEQELTREVQILLDAFRKACPEIRVMSVTPTQYEVEVRSLYGIISAFKAKESAVSVSAVLNKAA